MEKYMSMMRCPREQYPQETIDAHCHTVPLSDVALMVHAGATAGFRVHDVLDRGVVSVQGTPTWHKNRSRLDVTASILASIVGCRGAYQTPARVLQEKVTGQPPFPRTAFLHTAMQHGTINEERARREFEAVADTTVHECGLYEAGDAYPDAALGCSPDGFTTQGHLVEFKCPVSCTVRGCVPKYYLQVQFQMACCNEYLGIPIDVCWFVQLFTWEDDTEKRMHVQTVAYDRQCWEWCKDKVAAFAVARHELSDARNRMQWDTFCDVHLKSVAAPPYCIYPR